MEELFFAAMTPPAPDMATLLDGGDSTESGQAWVARVASGLLAYFRQLARC